MNEINHVDDIIDNEDIISMSTEALDEEADNFINSENETKNNEEENSISETEINISENSPKLDASTITKAIKSKKEEKEKEEKEKEEKEKKDFLISSLSQNYNVSKEEINKKINDYKMFSLLRDDFEKDITSENYLKQAIKEKKGNDEELLVKNIIESIVNKAIDDIENDKKIKNINKKEIYKAEYLESAKKEILRCVEEYHEIIEDNSIEDEHKKEEDIKKILTSNIFILFLKHFNVHPIKMNILSFSEMLYKKEGIKNFFNFLTLLTSGEKAKAKILDLYEKIDDKNFKIDSVFKL